LAESLGREGRPETERIVNPSWSVRRDMRALAK